MRMQFCKKRRLRRLHFTAGTHVSRAVKPTFSTRAEQSRSRECASVFSSYHLPVRMQIEFSRVRTLNVHIIWKIQASTHAFKYTQHKARRYKFQNCFLLYNTVEMSFWTCNEGNSRTFCIIKPYSVLWYYLCYLNWTLMIGMDCLYFTLIWKKEKVKKLYKSKKLLFFVCTWHIYLSTK